MARALQVGCSCRLVVSAGSMRVCTQVMPPRSRAQELQRAAAALRVVHPLPSLLNALIVVLLALVAGGELRVAGLLGVGMLGFQLSIGSLNDVVDAERDRSAARRKPIPSGLVSREGALAVVVLGGCMGLVISGMFGPLVLLLGATGYAAGLAYDLVLRRIGAGWLGFAIGFPVLLLWTWLAASASLPRSWPVLLPIAALAGPAIHLANSLVDLEADRRSGSVSLATQLGAQRSRRVLAWLTGTIYVLALAVLAVMPSSLQPSTLAVTAACLGAASGLALSWRDDARSRQAGWLLQAASLGLLAIVWTASIDA